MDEFGFIRKLLTPLSGAEEGALGLSDDAAVLAVLQGFDLVVTKDALVEGVHFTGGEKPSEIARKLLRVNLSDLAAMGAEPWRYFMALILPKSADEVWLSDFAKGLSEDQKTFGVVLAGGDTTRSNGLLGLSLTMLGLVPQGQALKRSGARAGDDIYVSGTLGDAALCLDTVLKKSAASPVCGLEEAMLDYLLQRYRLPEPRLALGQALRGLATASIDVSDGLVQDLEHICECSGVGAQINWPDLPKSDAVLARGDEAFQAVTAGGDDYELLFTAPASAKEAIAQAAQASGTRVTRIGQVVAGKEAVVLDANAKPMMLSRKGYKHF